MMQNLKMTISSNRQQGFSLIELMVAMTIGFVLIGGAFYVYSNTRNAYNTNAIYAGMQENARFAISFMEPDVNLAGFWGQHRIPAAVQNSALDRSDKIDNVVNDCDDNWVIQVDRYVEGTNNVAPTLPCFPAARYKADTDTLIIRRASPNPTRTAGHCFELRDARTHLLRQRLHRRQQRH